MYSMHKLLFATAVCVVSVGCNAYDPASAAEADELTVISNVKDDGIAASTKARVLASIRNSDGSTVEFIGLQDGITISADFINDQAGQQSEKEREFKGALVRSNSNYIEMYEKMSGKAAPRALVDTVNKLIEKESMVEADEQGRMERSPSEDTLASQGPGYALAMSASTFQQCYCPSDNYAYHPGVETQFDLCRTNRTNTNSYSDYVHLMISYVSPYRSSNGVTHYQQRRVLGGWETEHETNVLEGHTHYYSTQRFPRRTIEMGVSHADGEGYHVSYFGRTSSAAFIMWDDWWC